MSGPDLHPGVRIQKLTFGIEQAPLIVIDSLVANAGELVADAASRTFSERSRYYPGIRAEAPLQYQQLILTKLRHVLLDCLDTHRGSLRFSMCEYSLVTRQAHELSPPQRIPHVDSLGKQGLATIHYLFKTALGGTAFYRHRRTGFESLDGSRNETYVRCLQSETLQPHALGMGYINGDTDLFQQIAKQDGVFNRMLIYRRNSLHSGCIGPDFVPDANPTTGRLSINSFIDLVPE